MRVGPYAVLTQIGAGSDGIAYRARGVDDGRPVEVRVLDGAKADPTRWAALCKRVRTAALIDDPASARILEFQDSGDPPYLALDGAESLPLSEALGDRLPMTEPEAISIVLSLTLATAKAHRLGLNHGSISLDEARFEVGGRPFLDFTGTLTGPSPPASVEMADDILGLGKILHGLMAGATDVDDSSPPDAISKETINFVASSSDVTVTLDRLVREMLAADPADRPSAREVAARLDDLASAMKLPVPIETIDSAVGSALAQSGESGHPFSFVGQDSRAAFTLKSCDSAGKANGASRVASIDILSRENLGRYRILEKIGQGGMGAVFRGEDRADGTVVALKVLRPEWAAKPGAIRRFHKEARLLGEVNNPFVTNLLEVNEDDGIHFLVLEYVSGRSLDKILGERGKLDETEALGILADVARALTDAHERGIIHRDVKPDNILLTTPADGSPPRVKLSDFGLARHVVESESLQVTQPQAVVGTPQYMSPEQGSGAPVGPGADVYAMGITLYHMLAGQVPFSGTRLMDIIALHCNEPPPPLEKYNPALSDGIKRIVDRALAKTPEARYPDATAHPSRPGAAAPRRAHARRRAPEIARLRRQGPAPVRFLVGPGVLAPHAVAAGHEHRETQSRHRPAAGHLPHRGRRRRPGASLRRVEAGRAHGGMGGASL